VTFAPCATAEVKFLHDANLNTPRQGEVLKQFQMTRGTRGDGSWLIKLVVNDRNAPRLEILMPLTVGEFSVFKNLLQFTLPHLMGLGITFHPKFAMEEASILSDDGYQSAASREPWEFPGPAQTFY